MHLYWLFRLHSVQCCLKLSVLYFEELSSIPLLSMTILFLFWLATEMDFPSSLITYRVLCRRLNCYDFLFPRQTQQTSWDESQSPLCFLLHIQMLKECVCFHTSLQGLSNSLGCYWWIDHLVTISGRKIPDWLVAYTDERRAQINFFSPSIHSSSTYAALLGCVTIKFLDHSNVKPSIPVRILRQWEQSHLLRLLCCLAGTPILAAFCNPFISGSVVCV